MGMRAEARWFTIIRIRLGSGYAILKCPVIDLHFYGLRVSSLEERESELLQEQLEIGENAYIHSLSSEPLWG